MTFEDQVVVHDEVEIEDFEYETDTEQFTYPCPCGDEFVVLKVCNFNKDNAIKNGKDKV